MHGAWAAWGEWSDCDAECRGGVRSRTRSCADPPPKNGGQACPGDAVQTEPCNLQPCGDARGESPRGKGWGPGGKWGMLWGVGMGVTGVGQGMDGDGTGGTGQGC